MKKIPDCIVVGCGLAGSVIARELAERSGMNVLIMDRRNHIGGNAYDYINDDGILVHQYGPHIFHTGNTRVYDYLSRFTQWREYAHEVLADIHGKLTPVPFNLNSLYVVYDPEKACRLEQKLISVFGLNKRIPIAKLFEQSDRDLIELSDFIYRNIYLHYSQKQWGTPMEAIDPSITARVPILISRDNRYFQDAFQGMPGNGYASLFEKMLNHPGIDLQLNLDSDDILKITEDGVCFDNGRFAGTIVYTGALDELFGCRLGRLPYRTMDFGFETYDKEWFQSKGTVNYTVNMPFTRITEFKYLTGQVIEGKTTILKEYPREYTGSLAETPYYPVPNGNNFSLYDQYRRLAADIPNFHLLGRLAEYRYYNMDEIVHHALLLADRIVGGTGALNS